MDSYKIAFEDIFREGAYENLSYLSDGKLLTEDGRTFDIHKVVLAQYNRYFRALFCGINRDTSAVLIHGIKGEILNEILRYIYTGVIHINNRNICDMLITSDYLSDDNVVRQIEKYLQTNLSIENCFPIYRTAVKINHEQIAMSTYRFIQTNFEKLIHGNPAEFKELSVEYLKQFLEDNNLCVAGEHVVWYSIVQWVNKDTSQRFREVQDLLKCLKLGQVDEELARNILDDDIVSNNHFCQDLKIIESQNGTSNRFDALFSFILEIQSGHLEVTPTILQRRRYPKALHIITRYHIHNLNEGVQLYVTYDENIDIWRQLDENEFIPTFLTVMDCIVYMFDSVNNKSITFNLQDKEWRTLRNFHEPRTSYLLVTLGYKIFVIGGDSIVSGEDDLLVEFYVPEMDMWFIASPMLPIASYAAVGFNGKIYVIGKVYHDFITEMVAQVYDNETDDWLHFAPPSVFRTDFAFVEYHGKLYVLGGTDENGRLCKKVEVFDIARNTWEITTDLPYAYYTPKAIVFLDHLVIFDYLLEDPMYLKKSPPVQWNDKKESWEPLEKFLPLKDLALYLFCIVNDNKVISMLVKENRSPSVQFSKSPFNYDV